MPVLSAFEDFAQRSLSALPTLWEKLRFVSSLRDEHASYRHWGLEQKHGEKRAQAAIAESHSQLCGELASTRLAELWVAADQAARRETLEVSELLNCIDEKNTIPADLRGVAPEHFRFVVRNLTRVAHSRSSSSHLAA